MPKPIEIRLKKDPGVLVIAFDDDSEFEYTFEYLRVHSPSAEVRGHGPGQETLQTGKEGLTEYLLDFFDRQFKGRERDPASAP